MDSMAFPKTAYEFIEQYSFKDEKQEYTNGAVLIPVFRVKHMVEHYFPVEVVRCKDCKHHYENDDFICIGIGDDDFCSYGERREGE